MGLIEFQGETIVITLRKDGVNKSISPLLVEVTSREGLPAQFILLGARNYAKDINVTFQPEANDLLTINLVLKEEILSRSQLITPYYILEKDEAGRIVSIRIPLASRWADPEIAEEFKNFIPTKEEVGKENVAVSTKEDVKSEVTEEEEDIHQVIITEEKER